MDTGDPEYLYRLFVDCSSRAWSSRVAADWDVALRHGRELRAAVDRDPAVAAEVDAELALALFLRFDSPERTLTDEELRGQNRELVDELSGLLPSAGRSMLLGLSLLDRFDIDADPDDRAAGLALLAAALPELPDDAPLVPEALAMFAAALDQARLADGVDPAPAARMRDEAIVALERAGALFSPPERPDLVLLEAQLRCSRGDLTDDVADLRAGLRGLELFDSVAPPDDPERGYALLLQAMAWLRIWHLTDDPADRRPIVGRCDRAIAAGLPDDLVLDAHRRALDTVLGGGDSAAELAAARARYPTALAALDERPAAAPDVRAELAMALAGLSCELVGTNLDPDRLAALLEIARRHPDPHDEWQTLLDLLDAMHQFLVRVLAGSLDIDVLTELIGVWRRSGFAHLLGDQLVVLVGVLACADGAVTGDLGRLRAARELFEQQSGDNPDAGGPQLSVVRALALGIEAHRRARTDAERIAAVRRLAALAEAEPADPVGGQYLFLIVRTLAAVLGGTAPPTVPACPPDADPMGRLMYDLASGVANLGSVAAAARRPAELPRALAAAERDFARFPPSSPARTASALALAAGALHAARRSPTDAVAVAAAVRWHEVAAAQLGGPQHPLWARHAAEQGAAYRLRRAPGDLPASRRAGLAALRGHAWQALLQPGTEHSLTAAGAAAVLAAEVAGWCAADRADDDLVRAVEAGRGLVLHAATTVRGLARTLARLGEHDLVAEWLDADGLDRLALPAAGGYRADLHGQLRRRVLRALHAGDAAVLDPPEPVEIAAALRRLGSDALVYLMPGQRCGRAVVVPATGPVEVLELPGLAEAAAEPLIRYAEAYRRAHPPGPVRGRGLDLSPLPAAAQSPPPPAAGWPDELDRLLRWAWHAAAGPLVAASGRWRAGPLPRLVLVPVGHLAMVPWHAAVRDHDGRARHLVQDAVLSYAASARLLCDVVDRPPATGGTRVVIGNPTGDLPSAGVEAEALRAAFHPEAVYLGSVTGTVGRHGRGTPAEVLDQLTDRPCALLHLACHARAEPACPQRSHLLLAGAEPLEIGALLDRSPATPMPLDAVLLAACSTTVPGLDYDEAFSIATGFLAAGARSVVGSLWPVPDASTAQLMFMVHHFREVEGLPMADALRRAQLWMLDPGQPLPATFPADLVAPRLPAGEARRDPVGWAGFIHQGW